MPLLECMSMCRYKWTYRSYIPLTADRCMMRIKRGIKTAPPKCWHGSCRHDRTVTVYKDGYGDVLDMVEPQYYWTCEISMTVTEPFISWEPWLPHSRVQVLCALGPTVVHTTPLFWSIPSICIRNASFVPSRLEHRLQKIYLHWKIFYSISKWNRKQD